MIESNKIDSEADLMAAIHKLADAGGSLIQVRTREPVRAALTLRKNIIGSDYPYREWDIVNGWRNTFTNENFTDHKIKGSDADVIDALRLPLDELRNERGFLYQASDKIHFFIYQNVHPYLVGNPYVLELLSQYSAILPTSNVCMVLITNDAPLAEVPMGTVLTAELSTPGSDELEKCARHVISNTRDVEVELDDEDYKKLANLGLGLSLYEFETYLAIAIIEGHQAQEDTINLERLMSGIAQGKTAVVKQSEILELTHATDIADVGGMHTLKSWVEKRAGCYSDAAKEYGITPPKGFVLVGVPGTGKSLVAKAVAGMMQIPLVRLDFGRVFSKFVGDSEARVRAALKMVESMAPVVLFVDEIDKGLGGIGGGGDSGVSVRVLGTYLTWLQECTAPVFSIVTANRVDGLPPELLRQGRFDQIFAVTMPDEQERLEVLAIHLRKRGRNLKEYKQSEQAAFVEASKNYVPAEIEAAVKTALISAFHENADKVEMDHIITALKEMIPMSRSNAEAIQRIISWADNNAVTVSGPSEYKPATGEQKRRITIARPRRG